MCLKTCNCILKPPDSRAVLLQCPCLSDCNAVLSDSLVYRDRLFGCYVTHSLGETATFLPNNPAFLCSSLSNSLSSLFFSSVLFLFSSTLLYFTAIHSRGKYYTRSFDCVHVASQVWCRNNLISFSWAFILLDLFYCILYIWSPVGCHSLLWCRIALVTWL